MIVVEARRQSERATERDLRERVRELERRRDATAGELARLRRLREGGGDPGAAVGELEVTLSGVEAEIIRLQRALDGDVPGAGRTVSA